MSGNQMEEIPYILCGQINLWNSPTATTEIASYINFAMQNFRYDNEVSAGLRNDRIRKDNYKKRLGSIGIEVDDYDRVVSRPSQAERPNFRASYRKAQNRQSKENLVNTGDMQAPDGASQTLKDSIKDKGNPFLYKDNTGALPMGFIYGIQEPATDKKKKKIKGGLRGNVILKDTNCTDPRAIIFHSKNLNIWPVGEFTSRDMVTGLFSSREMNIYIVSAYLHKDDNPVIPDKLKELILLAKREKAQVLLMSDLNAHSPLWGSEITQEDNAAKRGREFERFFTENRMKVANRGNRSTYVRYNAQTKIDVTAFSPGLGDRIQHWEVADRAAFSDHCSIEFVLKMALPLAEGKRNLRKANLSLLTTKLEEKSLYRQNLWYMKEKPLEYNIPRLEEELDDLLEDVEEILDEVAPIQPPSCHIPNLNWYNNEHRAEKNRIRRMKRYVDERNELKKRHSDPTFGFTPDRYTEDDWRKARTAYRSKCRKDRHNFWKTSLEETPDIKKVAALRKALEGEASPPAGLMKKEGEVLNQRASVEFLSDTHFVGSSTKPCKDRRTSKKKIVNITDKEADFITPAKVQASISSFLPFKGPGPDALPPIVYQHFGPMAQERLMRLYKASTLLEYIPSRWLEIKVVFIPKPGKKNYSEPRAYRPISLMNFMFKIIEKIRLWDVEELVLQKNPLHKAQYGFRKGRSADTALTSLVGRIEKGLIDKKLGYSIVLFLDIEGAYDNITNGSIVRALKARGCSQNYINWTLDFLKFRKLTVDYKGEVVVRYARKGVPQGGISSPFLYSDAQDSLLAIFDNMPGVDIECYADDVALIATGNNLSVLKDRLQRAIWRAESWAKRNGLKFSTDKTEAVIFTRRRHSKPPKLSINNQLLNYSEHFKYLGVWLDPKLSFRYHLSQKVKKVKYTLHCLSSAMGKFWGISPQLALWAWRGIARPMLSYGCLVWGKVMDTQWAMKQMTSLQRSSFKLLTFFRRSTPTAGLEIITNTWPMDLFIKNTQAGAFLRTKGFEKHSDIDMYTEKPFLKGHRQRIWEWLYSIGCNAHFVTSTAVDDIVRRFMWGKGYKVDPTSMQDPKSRKYGLPKKDSDFSIYTDGSKDTSLRSGGGLAAFKTLPQKGENTRTFKEVEISLNDHMNSFHLGASSVFQSECYAVFRAAIWVQIYARKFNFQNKKIAIYSDSQALVHTLKGVETKSDLVYKTFSALNRAVCQTGANIVIRWVKGHDNHRGNERADFNARRGRDHPSRYGVPDVPSPTYKLLKSQIAAAVTRVWNERWAADTENYRQTRRWLPEVDPWFSAMILSEKRAVLSEYIMVLTGHNFFKRHNFLVDSERVRRGTLPPESLDSPFCDLCCFRVPDEASEWQHMDEYLQTSFHLFTQCEALATVRLQLFGQAFDKPLHTIKRKNIIKFMRQAGLYVFPSENSEITDRSEVLNMEEEN